MSITSALYMGVSGLNTHGIAMSVIGNNIANVNTIGFKAGRVTFEDILSHTVATSGSSGQLGGGSTLGDISAIFSQGSLQTTSRVTDLAISGAGFFMVKNPDTGGVFYTRSGAFSFDKNGNLVDPAGFIVQGWGVKESDGDIINVGDMQDINISHTSSAPHATESVQFAVNLDSTETTPEAFSLEDKDGTSNYCTNITVYDSLGAKHPVTIYFRKTDTGAPGEVVWEWFGVVGADDTQTGKEEIQAQGTLTFDEDGVLLTESEITYPTGGFDFTGGPAQDQTIDIRFGLQEGATSKSTQYASASSTIYQTQNGYASGCLQSISVDSDGVIYGRYSNGQIDCLYRIALANFTNIQGLAKEGGGLYSESPQSGEAFEGMPGTSGLGSIMSNSLEQSNVDMGGEFVDMIVVQRGFQANSKIITTVNEMLGEFINMKR